MDTLGTTRVILNGTQAVPDVRLTLKQQLTANRLKVVRRYLPIYKGGENLELIICNATKNGIKFVRTNDYQTTMIVQRGIQNASL